MGTRLHQTQCAYRHEGKYVQLARVHCHGTINYALHESAMFLTDHQAKSQVLGMDQYEDAWPAVACYRKTQSQRKGTGARKTRADTADRSSVSSDRAESTPDMVSHPT